MDADTPLEEKISFIADISLLQSMMRWIRDRLLQVRGPESEKRKVEIALEEALVNIISYAYPNGVGMLEIMFSFLPDGKLIFSLKDKGVPFNPAREESEIETMLSLEEREEGGLGIPMIHKLVDKVDYKRLEGANVLSVSKYFQLKK